MGRGILMFAHKVRAVLLGPPNAGKGVAGEYLSEEAGIRCISTGQLLRAEIAAETEIGLQLKAELDKGHFAPDHIVEGIVSEFVKNADTFALDGFPRNVPQAEFLERELNRLSKPLNVVIFLDAPDDVIIERAVTRLTCKSCRRVTSTRHTACMTCEVCGGQLFRRDDDTEVIVRERLVIYREQTAPLVTFYRSKGILHEIAAGGSIPELYSELKKILDRVHETSAVV